MSAAVLALTGRDRAILRAVSTGCGELTGAAMSALLLEGRFCCDQPAADRLVRAGLIAPTTRCAPEQRVPAVLTPAGRSRLAASTATVGEAS